MKFESLELSTALLRAIDDQGYTHTTPIQQQAIPAVLNGRDILAGSQTGTGKTAAFALPILQLLSRKSQQHKSARPRALILTPTRELAAQVGESVSFYGRYLPLRSSVIFGGVKIGPQITRLRAGVDIVVATPGRLLDHVSQKTLDLAGIDILVLDEADRMLDMGFIHDIRRVMKLIPKQRQTLLFSATFSDDIRRLAGCLLKEPLQIDVAPRNATVKQISQCLHTVEKSGKRALLSWLIGSGDWQQVLVFARTKHGANRLARQLTSDGLVSAAIHGNKSQGARTRALAEFKSGKLRVLVATDIAARGLDIERLPHVVNYELPNVPEDYVHRIGRTGRAGMTGEAVSLVSTEEKGLLRDIERLLGKSIPHKKAEGFELPKTSGQKSQPDTRSEQTLRIVGNATGSAKIVDNPSKTRSTQRKRVHNAGRNRSKDVSMRARNHSGGHRRTGQGSLAVIG
ncbi:MAG TPA: DEAD/DEAH box helicase [Gammaproteobacteria bacterium]|nr:DEAD/DEAH box helicase [Gammaproteobacteria bacterium]